MPPKPSLLLQLVAPGDLRVAHWPPPALAPPELDAPLPALCLCCCSAALRRVRSPEPSSRSFGAPAWARRRAGGGCRLACSVGVVGVRRGVVLSSFRCSWCRLWCVVVVVWVLVVEVSSRPVRCTSPAPACAGFRCLLPGAVCKPLSTVAGSARKSCSVLPSADSVVAQSAVPGFGRLGDRFEVFLQGPRVGARDQARCRSFRRTPAGRWRRRAAPPRQGV